MDSAPYSTDRVRQLTARLTSEGDALASARELAKRFAGNASMHDRQPLRPLREVDALSQSGLLAITVPPEYGGIDVSNSVLAEITAILAEPESLIGQLPLSHFYILEALRVDGTEEQKRFFFSRAMAGERFGNAFAAHGTETPGQHNIRLTHDGIGYRLDGRAFNSTGVTFADWVTVFALDENDRLTMSFVQRGTDGIKIIDNRGDFGQRTTGRGITVLDNVYVQADAVVLHYKGFERPTTIGPVGQIVHAGIDLGIARAAFAQTIDFIKTRSRPWTGGPDVASKNPLTIARVGELAIRLEAATALVERAGLKVDIAQISMTEENVIAATLAAAAAKVLTSEIALNASSTLCELAGTTSTGTTSTGTDLNLDRHRRDARTNTPHDPVSWKYHVVGDYHLNGTVPPGSGAISIRDAN